MLPFLFKVESIITPAQYRAVCFSCNVACSVTLVRKILVFIYFNRTVTSLIKTVNLFDVLVAA